MTYQGHSISTSEWQKLTLSQKLANIGAEVGRAINWQSKNQEYSQTAFYRALDLLSLTIDTSTPTQNKELCRLYEVLVDYFTASNEYGSNNTDLQKYFLPFNLQAAKQRSNI